MKMGWAMLALCACGAVVGCSNPQRRAKTVDHEDLGFDTADTTQRHKPGIVTLPGELRSVYIAGNQTESLLRYCAEPAPDIAAQAALKVATSLEGALNSEASGSSSSGANDTAESVSASGKSGGNAKLTNNVEHTVTVLELAGRSQAVLLTRELAYRVCELRLNGAITNAEAKTLLEKVVDVSTTLAQADKATADAKKATADAAASDAKAKELEAKTKAAQAETIKGATQGMSMVNQKVVEAALAKVREKHVNCLKDAKQDTAKILVCETTWTADLKSVVDSFK